MTPYQELILIRHGQSTANAQGVWQGQMEFPLSETGRRQARLAGNALADEPIDGLYSSPLGRAYETAEIIARQTGFSGPIPTCDGLTERGGGILEGHTWEERKARNPELVEKFLALPEEERWSLVGAETDEEVVPRFEEALCAIRARHPAQEGGTRVVVVSHGGVMRAYLRTRFGAEVLPGTQRAANASITRLAWGPDGDDPRLLQLSSTDHLTTEDGPQISAVE